MPKIEHFLTTLGISNMLIFFCPKTEGRSVEILVQKDGDYFRLLGFQGTTISKLA
jgi:hypothetical protein